MAEELDKLREHAEKIAKRENCFLYDLELVGKGNARTLRVFIDKESEEGVSIDDCSNVSRGLDLVLDVEDLVPGGSYQLEVSSPGLDRSLKKSWHYEKAIGENVAFQLSATLGEILEGRSPKDQKRKRISGQIMGVSEAGVEVLIQELPEASVADPVQIPFKYIHKARVIFAHPDTFTNKKPKSRKV